MKKLLEKWDNLCILIEAIKDNPKKSLATLTVIVIIGLGLFVFVTKTPNALKCSWEAWYVKGFDLTSEDWRFNWLSSDWNDQCQRQRSSDGLWIPMNKSVDTGIGEGSEVEGLDELNR